MDLAKGGGRLGNRVVKACKNTYVRIMRRQMYGLFNRDTLEKAK